MGKKTETELQIELWKIRTKFQEERNKNILEQLRIKKEIALIYHSKKQLNKIEKREKKEMKKLEDTTQRGSQ
jgi:hypothetical protein